MNNCLRAWPAPQPVIKGLAVPTDILSGRERASSKSSLPNVPLFFPLPLLSPGAYSKGPFPEVLVGEEGQATQCPFQPTFHFPAASLDLFRDSPSEQQGPASSSSWPHQCLFINYANDNNSSSAGRQPQTQLGVPPGGITGRSAVRVGWQGPEPPFH